MNDPTADQGSSLAQVVGLSGQEVEIDKVAERVCQSQYPAKSIRILSSAEWVWRVLRRMFLTSLSAASCDGAGVLVILAP